MKEISALAQTASSRDAFESPELRIESAEGQRTAFT